MGIYRDILHKETIKRAGKKRRRKKLKTRRVLSEYDRAVSNWLWGGFFEPLWRGGRALYHNYWSKHRERRHFRCVRFFFFFFLTFPPHYALLVRTVTKTPHIIIIIPFLPSVPFSPLPSPPLPSLLSIQSAVPATLTTAEECPIITNICPSAADT